jgi:hypothetical protein
MKGARRPPPAGLPSPVLSIDPRHVSLQADEADVLDVAAAPAPAAGPVAARGPIAPARAWLAAHETALWWLHSLYALAFGVGVMWLGSRNYAFLQIAFAQVLFIWATSLVLPLVAAHATLPRRVGRLTELAITYFHKNFYQQLLFFSLPVYWASVTLWSANVIFIVIVAVSAVLSTLDIVYDRHVSKRRELAAPFFALNLFACANVALPVVWSLGNTEAIRLSALLAFVGFATLRYSPRHWLRFSPLRSLVLAAALLAVVAELGRPFIPPAPLRLVSGGFGQGVSARAPTLLAPLDALPAETPQRVFALTAVFAPLGLNDRVRHRWTVDGATVYASRYYEFSGGRPEGYRLWTYATLPALPAGARVVVSVETEGGQLIGQVSASAAPRPAGTSGR